MIKGGNSLFDKTVELNLYVLFEERRIKPRRNLVQSRDAAFKCIGFIDYAPSSGSSKALNSWAAVQDSFYATKEIFESHKIVFTVSTSIASVATAWAGYSFRHLHESRVDQRLESIEKAMKNNHPMQDPEFKKLVSGTISLPACVATAGTTLIIGYGLGWRGGTWYANRKFRKEQMKLLGQMKPKRWPLKFLRRPFIRPKLPENAAKISESTPKDATVPTRNRQSFS